MDRFDVSIIAVAVDWLAPLILVVFAIATITGNFAAKRFFELCGLQLRGRYRAAAVIGIVGVAFATGERAEHASIILIAVLVGLSALAWRAGSTWHVAAISAISTALLVVEVATGGGL